MKKSRIVVLLVIVSVILGFGINLVQAADLKAVSFAPRNHPLINPHGHELIKMLNKALQGQAKFKYIGGPEVIPAKEQVEAVKNNVVQLSMLPTAYHASHTPIAATMILAKADNAMELRKSDYHKIISEDYEKIGVKYLGPTAWFIFHMWLKEPVKSLEDLKGRKMRSFFIYDRFQRALGITPVNMPLGEVYTALERGVVDGFCMPLIGPREIGLTKLAKFIIPYGFYLPDVMTIMNLDTWNKLGKAGQKKVEEVITNEYEPYMMKYFTKLNELEWDLLAKEGVKKITFTDEQAKKYLATAYQAKWAEYAEKLPADVVKKLKKAAAGQ